MNKVLKLVIFGFLIFFSVIFIWTINPALASLLGSTSIVFFIGMILEVKEYLNRRIYLWISMAILIIGLILMLIYVIKFDYIPEGNRAIFYILAGLLTVGTLYNTFSSTREWNKG